MSKPVVNLADVPLREGGNGKQFAAKLGRIGALIGATKLGCQLHIVPPGKKAFPRHAHHVNEEMFFVLSGQGTYRLGEETYPIREGDVISAPAGDASTRASDRQHGRGRVALSRHFDAPRSRRRGISGFEQVRGRLDGSSRQGAAGGQAALYRPPRRLARLFRRRGVRTKRCNEQARSDSQEILSVEINGKPILDGLDLTVKAGEVAAIMGPNGSGKSTLSYVIAGKPDYEVTSGEVLLDGENILELSPDERAAKGLFLAFQYPIEIPGVATMTFLKARSTRSGARAGEADLTTPDFMRAVRGAAQSLKIDPEMLQAPAQRRLFRRREEAHGNPADDAARAAPRHARRDRLRASTSTRCASSPRASTRCATRSAPSSSSPTTSACSNHITPDVVHVMAQGPHRQDRRPRAGAGARAQRLSRLRRGRRVRTA